jgi:hypothetical protein
MVVGIVVIVVIVASASWWSASASCIARSWCTGIGVVVIVILVARAASTPWWVLVANAAGATVLCSWWEVTWNIFDAIFSCAVDQVLRWAASASLDVCGLGDIFRISVSVARAV